jgi:hypothetical protein
VFAAAEVQSPVFAGFIFQRGEICAFVGTIAERLSGTFTASAPEIFTAAGDIDSVGTLLGDIWITHGRSSVNWQL